MIRGLNTELEFKKNIEIVKGKNQFIAKYIENKTVLSIGCVDMIDTFDLNQKIVEGKYQFTELSKYAKSITGVDINQSGVTALKKLGYDVHCVDITGTVDSPIYKKKWDIVILSHVIEHVPDIFTFLSATISKLDFDEIIIAVPNAYQIGNLRNVLRGREIISNDHYYTFTPVTILKLLETVGIRNMKLYSDKRFLDFKEAKNLKEYIKIMFRNIENSMFRGLGDLIMIGEKSHKR